ncbi:Uu.00g090930.m01.CDS01 [Anthostomella pinea]|uniref:Uu.00g090930.m01.CDS01 n=1 Tax=Anthostomella pinea TaxID=933095 RepID=A0AAI8YKC5_9PEZI|nr:Uu.00g090930.m01.CDS01 [Anthostomella pinea]
MPFFLSAAMASSQLLPPFCVEHQLKLDLYKDLGSSRPVHHLSGYPHIALDDWHRIRGFLDEEFCSDDLDKMADRLWWMTKQDSASIYPTVQSASDGWSSPVGGGFERLAVDGATWTLRAR